jgi:predicted DNA-binding transcriptional regulator AlpA
MTNTITSRPMILDRTGISNASLHVFVKEGSFPKPISLEEEQ